MVGRWEQLALFINIFVFKFFFKKTQRAHASSAHILKKESRKQLPTQISTQCGSYSYVREIAWPQKVWFRSRPCHQQAVAVGGNLHSGKQEHRVECLLRSSPSPALALSLLSTGEVTIARGAERDEGVGTMAVPSTLCAGEGIHSPPAWPLNRRPCRVSVQPSPLPFPLTGQVWWVFPTRSDECSLPSGRGS